MLNNLSLQVDEMLSHFARHSVVKPEEGIVGTPKVKRIKLEQFQCVC